MKLYKLYFIFIAFALCGCTSVEQIEEETKLGDVVTIELKNLPFTPNDTDNESTPTRASVDGTAPYLFYHEKGDTVGLFPEDGFQIPFIIPLEEGIRQSNVQIKAEGWRTEPSKSYVAYFPFVYENRNSKKIPFSYLGQKQSSADDVSNLARYSYRISNQSTYDEVTQKFTFSMKDLGAVIVARLTLPEGTYDKKWHKMVIQSSSPDVFQLEGYVDLFSPIAENGLFTPTVVSSFISIDLGDYIGHSGADAFEVYLKVPETTLPSGTKLTCLLYDIEGNVYVSYRDYPSGATWSRGNYARPKFEVFEFLESGAPSNTSADVLSQKLDEMVIDSNPVKSFVVTDNSPVIDEITIPSAVAQSGVSSVNITFENPVATTEANTSNTIVITDNSASSASVQEHSLSQVNLKFADNTSFSPSEIPSLDINLPSSTVTLDRNSGAVLFNVVTTKTAKSTLVVKTGVFINTLIIEGGNVIIENGATVGEIINKAPGQSTIVNWNDGGSTDGEVNAEISGFQSGN